MTLVHRAALVDRVLRLTYMPATSAAWKNLVTV
jgi:hypothetical protein